MFVWKLMSPMQGYIVQINLNTHFKFNYIWWFKISVILT